VFSKKVFKINVTYFGIFYNRIYNKETIMSKSICSKEYKLVIERLKEARIETGLKQKEVAKKLATIHMLLGLVVSKMKVDIPISAICPLLYTDGVFKNLFNYLENCLDWLRYLNTDKKESSLHTVFFNEHYSVNSLMNALKEFFEKIQNITQENKRGNDKIKISDTRGMPINLEKNNGTFSITTDEQLKGASFISILSDLTGWRYKQSDWTWNNFRLKKFNKGLIRPNNKNFEKIIKKNPISWAMTSGLAIEYTLDPKNIFLK